MKKSSLMLILCINFLSACSPATISAINDLTQTSNGTTGIKIEKTVSLSGEVLDSITKLPISGIKVTLDQFTTQTNENGIFTFQNISKGKHILVLSKENYLRLSKSLDLNDNDALSLLLTKEIVPNPSSIPEPIVTPSSSASPIICTPQSLECPYPTPAPIVTPSASASPVICTPQSLECPYPTPAPIITPSALSTPIPVNSVNPTASPNVEPTSLVSISTFAGNGNSGNIDSNLLSSSFDFPQGLVFDNLGNLFIADQRNFRIRKIDTSGNVSTIAGSGSSGYLDGESLSAKFSVVKGLAIDSTKNLFVVDNNNHCIRKITPNGIISTYSGNPNSVYNDAPAIDGPIASAEFYYPSGIAIDDQDNIFITEYHRIRKISSNGIVSTLAGNARSGFADGIGSEAKFHSPFDIAIDKSTGIIYVADAFNNRIRKIASNGEVTTLAGSTGGFADGIGSEAKFNIPTGITIDNNLKVLYVSELGSHLIRKVTLNGKVTTIAGSALGYLDGTGFNSKFNSPEHITLNSNGEIFISDRGNNRIRKIKVN